MSLRLWSKTLCQETQKGLERWLTLTPFPVPRQVAHDVRGFHTLFYTSRVEYTHELLRGLL